GRRDPQPDLCGCLQPGSGFLRFLSFDAGLRARPEEQRNPNAAHARIKLFPLFRRSLWQAAGKSGATGRPRAQPIANARVACRTALGLVFVIEGLIFAAFPDAAKRAMTSVLKTSDAPNTPISSETGRQKPVVCENVIRRCRLI